ncbi:DUF1508 domain-containing protein [Candidatus Saccharibacteria bacterium]|nr:DUF1508 domain-containing protein [Candidatus Saccharibacteria bacterium]
MYFQIFKNPSLQQPYWWVIKSSGNHEIMCHSEMLSSKQACINAIAKICREAGSALYYDRTGE